VLEKIMLRTIRVAVCVSILALTSPLLSAGHVQQGTAQDSDKPVLLLSGDAAMITILIKPDRTADFELVLNKLKEALQKSEKPERQQQAAGWQVYKATQPVQGNIAYIMRIDPVVKGQEYDISRLIAEVFPVEVQEIFPKYRDAFAGRAIADVLPLMMMRP
jgi:hypothetical protein